MITDTHLGVRNSLEEWIDIHRDYFYNHFIPMVKREYRPGDVLFHMGDVFDSRHAITLKVLNLGIDIFEELSCIFKDGIYIIAGNHDCWFRTTNEINSLKPLKRIPNVRVFDMSPETILVGKSRFLMMPWQKDHDADVAAIKQHGQGHDYLMCHMDVYGMKGSRFNTIEYGVDVKAFSMFKQVYSGHIHFRQKLGNITMLGTPYELTRSDMYNDKGIVVLDANTGEETFFKNDFSPRFVNIAMSEMLEKSPEQIDSIFSNNFVDVHVDSANFMKIPVNSILDLIGDSYRGISFIPPSLADTRSLQMDEDADLKDFDVRDSIDVYCNGTPYDGDIKKKLRDSLYKLYDRAKEQMRHEKIDMS